MGDLNGLLSDPEFQKLDLPTQRQALSHVDPDFAKLSDEDFVAFKQKATPQANTNPFKTFVNEAFSRLNPISAVQGVVQTGQDFINDPYESMLSASPIGALMRAKDAYNAGDKKGAMVHLGAMLSQGISGAPPLEENAALKVAHGDVAEGLGDVAGDALGMGIGEKVLPPLGRGIAKSSTLIGRALGAFAGHSAGGGFILPAVGRDLGGALMDGLVKPSSEAPITKVGVPPSASAPTEATTNPILDQIAQGMSGKRFDELDSGSQAAVRQVANRISTAPENNAAPNPSTPAHGYGPDWWKSAAERAAPPATVQVNPGVDSLAGMPVSVPPDVAGVHGGVEGTPVQGAPQQSAPPQVQSVQQQGVQSPNGVRIVPSNITVDPRALDLMRQLAEAQQQSEAEAAQYPKVRRRTKGN